MATGAALSLGAAACGGDESSSGSSSGSSTQSQAPPKPVAQVDQLTGRKQAAPSAPLFFLDGRTLKPLKANKNNGTAVLEGTTVQFKDESAKLLNETFGTDALNGGRKVGTAKITVDTQ